jgi:predicted  nucleic acid-binding Zn-ribbon protein
MKYYCKNCGSVFTPGGTVDIALWSVCPFCGKEKLNNMIIASYETPQQYEKRTGKEFSNEGAVWFRPKNGSADFIWGICRYVTAKKCGDRDIVIADPPVQPPDDWRPEKGNKRQRQTTGKYY